MADKLYELINPSDAYTFFASSPEVAAVAAWHLSGMYGARCMDDPKGESYGPAIFGEPAKFTEKTGGIEKFLEEGHEEEIVRALESFVIGTRNREDRDQYEATIKALRPEAVADWKAAWDDKHRSSLNNIGAYAASLAVAIRKALTERKAAV